MDLLRRATHFLWAACLLLGVGIFGVFMRPFQDKVVDSAGLSVSVDEKVQGQEGRTKEKTFKDYEKIFSGRDVFQSAVISSRKGNEQRVGAAEDGRFITDSYKIVGILIDQRPEAVFEDVKSRETVFLSPGDLLGNATVEKILPGKVVLNIDGRVIEMVP